MRSPLAHSIPDLGSGLRTLSVAPAQVGRVKQVIAEPSAPETSSDDDDGK